MVIRYYKTSGLFWIRIFGYGIAITINPTFSQRRGLKGGKIGKFYYEYLTP